MHNIFSQSTKKEIFDLERLLSSYKEERGRRMTDYEFVEKVVEVDSCDFVGGDWCGKCPIRNGPCTNKNIIVKAKAWLESHKKENSMDGIKVAVEEKKAEEKAKYPCYKIVNGREDDRAIVLFTAPRRGFVVVTSSINNVLGMGCDTWAEDQFIPFHGTIKIEVE